MDSRDYVSAVVYVVALVICALAAITALIVVVLLMFGGVLLTVNALGLAVAGIGAALAIVLLVLSVNRATRVAPHELVGPPLALSVLSGCVSVVTVTLSASGLL